MAKPLQLSDHYGYGNLLRFTAPSIVMMIFTSVYGVVDGLFVSNFTGKIPFAAVNLIWPYVMIFGVVGFIFGTGGSALVAKTYGEGNRHRANYYFSLLTYLSIAIGIVLALGGHIFLRPVARLMGAEGKLLEDSVLYGRILITSTPLLVLQYLFQPFMIAAEKPGLNLKVTLAAGLANIILDALFIAVFKWGLAGAAAATVIGQAIGGIIPLVYFSRKDNPTFLRLGRTNWDGPAVAKSCVNGISEFVTNISMSLVSMIYNSLLLKMSGEDGVAAYGVIMYVSFVFMAIFIGYSMGVSPVVSFHYGAENREELRGILKRSIRLLLTAAVIITAGSILTAESIANIFVGYDEGLRLMTKHALKLYAITFLIAPINIFASSFFTALNDGISSGVISLSRMLVFQCTAVLLLPIVLDLDGIWLAMPAAEFLSLAVSTAYILSKRKHFGY